MKSSLRTSGVQQHHIFCSPRATTKCTTQMNKTTLSLNLVRRVRATCTNLELGDTFIMSPRTGNLPQCEASAASKDPALVPFDTIKIVFGRIEKSRRPEKSRPCFSLAFVRGQLRLFLFSLTRCCCWLCVHFYNGKLAFSRGT